MPRKGENIYKRKDGRWEGRYIKARSNLGKTSYGYVYAKTYREAKAKLKEAAMLGSKSEANLRNTNSDLFECAATEWFEATKLLVKESTSNKYWNLLKLYILPEIGNLPINCITHDVIESYCNLLLLSGGVKKSGLSAKTVSDALSVVRSILRYSAKKGTVISSDIHSIQVRQHVKESCSLLKAILSDINDKQMYRKVEKAYDLIQSSPVKSSPSVHNIESQVMNEIDNLGFAVRSGDDAAISASAEKIVRLANERNRLLRLAN